MHDKKMNVNGKNITHPSKKKSNALSQHLIFDIALRTFLYTKQS